MFIVILVILGGIFLLVAIIAGIYTGTHQGCHRPGQAGQKDKKGASRYDDTVYVYPNGKVYHRSMFCSDSQSVPKPMSERVAQIQGLHRCTKCWK